MDRRRVAAEVRPFDGRNAVSAAMPSVSAPILLLGAGSL
jgi:hypothetical protein